jgi:hypothetical protein
MEWITLLLLAPLLMVPVVMLWGYAGCGFNIEVGPPGVPTGLMVTSVSASSVALSWFYENESPGVVFEIERDPVAEPPLTATDTAYADVGLLPRTLYRYKVRATYGMQVSDYTEQVDATTLPPNLCFTAALTTNQAGLEGFCIVQRIQPARLAFGGTQVFITLRGATNANLVIDRIFISQGSLGGNPYDSLANDLTLVANGVTMVAGAAMPLQGVRYNLDRSVPLLVIFDINATPGNGNVRYVTNVPATDAVMYFRQATAEAAVADRLPSAANPGASPYIVSNSIYLIETIEVA